MSDTKRHFMGIISICVLAFCWWYYFTPQGQAWKANQHITKDWNNKQIEWNESWEAARKEETPVLEYEEPLESTVEPKEPVKEEVDDSSKKVTTQSSGRHPIQLTNKRNYVTGRNVTYVVPGDMRRLKLKIQDRVGRNLSTYTLPNSFISVKANQRITIVVE